MVATINYCAILGCYSVAETIAAPESPNYRCISDAYGLFICECVMLCGKSIKKGCYSMLLTMIRQMTSATTPYLPGSSHLRRGDGRPEAHPLFTPMPCSARHSLNNNINFSPQCRRTDVWIYCAARSRAISRRSASTATLTACCVSF